MALIVSAASGNFNAGATWVGGVVPGVGDEARASTGHTVTIDVDTTCDKVSNAGTGKFVLPDGITLTANVESLSTTTNIFCVEFNSESPATASIVGNCTIPLTANITSAAVANRNSGTLNITGNCTGGGGAAGASVLSAVRNASTGIINITGNCTGGSGTFGNHSAALNLSTGQINITGNCTGGTGEFFGAFQSSIGTLTIIGTVTASQTAAGVAGANVRQVTILSGPFITETTRGVNPVYCAAWRWNASPSNSTFLEVMTNDLLTKRNLVTADNVTGMPDEADVKDGVVYGPASELTGTFEQTVAPSVEEIRDAVWGAATSSLTVTGSIGERLKNSATVATTGDQLSAALTPP
jgi:hypothetical protein